MKDFYTDRGFYAFAKLCPNFSFSWAKLVFILNFAPYATHQPIHPHPSGKLFTGHNLRSIGLTIWFYITWTLIVFHSDVITV